MRATVRILTLVVLSLGLWGLSLSCGGNDNAGPDAAHKKKDTGVVVSDVDSGANDTQDGAIATGQDAAAAAGLDAATVRPDAAAPAGLDASSKVCTAACYSDWDCSQTCPAPPTNPGNNCCNTANGTCFVVAQANCTQPAGLDASTTTLCPSACSSDYDCQFGGCPAPPGGSNNCCDTSTTSCYVYAALDCPAGMDAGGIGPY